jgi:hypothetical protein
MDRRFAGRTSCQRRAIFFSSLQGCTRHAFPSPANDQYHHQPYQLLRSGRILAKFAKLPVVRLPIEIWWCCKAHFGNHSTKFYNNRKISPIQDARNCDMELFAEF